MSVGLRRAALACAPRGNTRVVGLAGENEKNVHAQRDLPHDVIATKRRSVPLPKGESRSLPQRSRQRTYLEASLRKRQGCTAEKGELDAFFRDVISSSHTPPAKERANAPS